MSVLTLRNIVLHYRERPILDNVSLQLNDGDKACLVGANGSGKTTLLNIISGSQKPDEGEVTLSKGASFSYLEQQTSSLDGNLTVEEELLKGFFKNAKEDHEKQKAITPLLDGFGFRQDDRKRKCSDFSLGWQMRISLVKALSSGADFLLLDEPTNYLDIECRLFLRDFLRRTKSAFLLVSHDRNFLDSTCQVTYELLAGDIIKHSGNYSFYEKQRAERYSRAGKEIERREKEKRDLTEFIERFRSKPTKARQVQERIKRLEKIGDAELFERSKSIRFSFPSSCPSPAVLLECEDASFSYDGMNSIVKDLTFALNKGDRVALIGANGMGKTTLMRLLSGQLSPGSGAVRMNPKTRVSYFSQDAIMDMDGSRTILEEISAASGCDGLHVRSMLGAFLFSGEDIGKRIAVLSGGEKARVAICKMLLSPVNLLLLDEVTNHLDIMGKDALEKALLQFDGSMAFVSHDIGFIKAVANKVIHFGKTGQRVFQGDFSYFAYKAKTDPELSLTAFANMEDDASFVRVKAPDGRLSSDASEPGASSSREDRDGLRLAQAARLEREESKRRKNDLAKMRRRLADLEEDETELSARLEQSRARLSTPEVYCDAVEARKAAEAIAEMEARLAEIETEYFSLMEAVGGEAR